MQSLAQAHPPGCCSAQEALSPALVHQGPRLHPAHHPRPCIPSHVLTTQGSDSEFRLSPHQTKQVPPPVTSAPLLALCFPR